MKQEDDEREAIKISEEAKDGDARSAILIKFTSMILTKKLQISLPE